MLINDAYDVQQSFYFWTLHRFLNIEAKNRQAVYFHCIVEGQAVFFNKGNVLIT